MRHTIFALLLSLPFALAAINPAQVRWHNEASDTTRITTLLTTARARVGSDNPQDYVMVFARGFIGTPYQASTLESDDGTEWLTVNLDSFDCTTFVETVIALSRTAASGRTSWRDYINNLEALRYRSGTMGGYASRLHYVADWIIDTSARGLVTDATTSLPTPDYVVKTLDYMSTHRQAYPALATDSANYAAIKKVEEGYRSHRFPYIRKSRVAGDKTLLRQLHDGDIVALTTDIPGLDVSHFGIIAMTDGVPYLLHASQSAGKVTVSATPLGDYLKRGKRLSGIRVIRLPR